VNEAFVVLLQYGDQSGVQKIWGPFDNEEAAKVAMAKLESWPMCGLWSVEPLAELAGSYRAAADGHIGPAWDMHPIAEAAYRTLPVDSCGQTFTAERTDDGVRRHAFGHPEPIAAHVTAEVLRALDAWIAEGNTYTSLTALAEEIAP
jgi:hypothetical protein